MSRVPPREGRGNPDVRQPALPIGERLTLDDISLDDIDDAEFDLADVITPPGPQPEPPSLAAGSELRRRIVIDQHEPSSLDLQLIAYLLDIEPPPDDSSVS